MATILTSSSFVPDGSASFASSSEARLSSERTTSDGGLVTAGSALSFREKKKAPAPASRRAAPTIIIMRERCIAEVYRQGSFSTMAPNGGGALEEREPFRRPTVM